MCHKNNWYVTGNDMKGLVTRNTHVKYMRATSLILRSTKVKIFEKYVKLQGQGL